MTIEWNGGAFQRQLQRELEARMQAGALVIRDALRAEVSRPNPDGTNPSKPGEPPKMVTGRGRESIGVTIGPDGTELTVVGYMAMLNDGTRRIAPRPWIEPVLQRVAPDVHRAMAAASTASVGSLPSEPAPVGPAPSRLGKPRRIVRFASRLGRALGGFVGRFGRK